MAGGSTGERPFTDILTSVRYWLIHGITIPALFVSGYAVVSSGAVYEFFGTPRPDEYYVDDRRKISVVNSRFNVNQEIEELIAGL